jgi:hypothetical protein
MRSFVSAEENSSADVGCGGGFGKRLERLGLKEVNSKSAKGAGDGGESGMVWGR